MSIAHRRGSSRLASAEVHYHLLGLPTVDEEGALLTPVHEVLHHSSVLRVIVVTDEANNRAVVGELLQNTAARIVSEVCSVEGEEKGGQIPWWAPTLQVRRSDTQSWALTNRGWFVK